MSNSMQPFMTPTPKHFNINKNHNWFKLYLVEGNFGRKSLEKRKGQNCLLNSSFPMIWVVLAVPGGLHTTRERWCKNSVNTLGALALVGGWGTLAPASRPHAEQLCSASSLCAGRTVRAHPRRFPSLAERLQLSWLRRGNGGGRQRRGKTGSV